MVSDAELLRSAIAPRTLGERVRMRLSGGWTAAQTLERLPSDVREEWLGDGSIDAQRRAVDRVYRALLALAAEGAVRRTKVRYTMALNTKGPRDMLVDVFRP